MVNVKENINEWDLKPLSDIIVDMHQGINTAADKVEYSSAGIQILQSKHITKGFLDFSDARYLNNNDFNKYKSKYVPNKGDILFCNIGTIGKTVVVNTNKEFLFAWNLFLIRLNKELVIPEYLKYYFDILESMKFYNRFLTGGTVKFVNKTKMGSIKVPLPPLETQKKIVEILEKAEKLKEWRAEADELADEYLKSVFLEMFGDPQNNHHNFKVGKIQDLVTKTQYGTSSKANEENKGYPILRMNNITHHGKWDFSSIKHIELNDKDKEKCLVKKGELLFNRTNSKELVGKAAVYRKDEPMAFAGYLVKLSTDSPVTSEYIAAHLNSPYGKAVLFNMAKSIVGMANINAKEVQRVPILIPPMDLREKYAEIVKRHENLRESQAQSKQEIDNLFNTLMQKAFKGELVC